MERSVRGGRGRCKLYPLALSQLDGGLTELDVVLIRSPE